MTLNVLPSADLIRSIANQSLSIKLALCEWIDNSLDAGANCVRIEFTKDSVSVNDDGNGTDDLAPFARLGKHQSHKTTRLGRYGIGSKDAALYLGGEASLLTVRSVHGGISREVPVDWGKMIATGLWEVADPVERPSLPGEIGTTIEVAPLNRKIPEGKAWSDLLSDLGYLYAPAIKNGAQILVKARTKGAAFEPLHRWKLPALEDDFVDRTFSVRGKGVRVFAGVVKDGVPNDRPGLTYAHGFRVIKQACADGCGDHSTSRIAGWVVLDASWRLNKNKDGIQHDDELYAEIEKAIASVLLRGQQTSMQLASAALSKQVEDIINAGLHGSPDAKARRGEGESKGGRTPTGKGGKHRRAREEQDGATFARQRFGRVRVEFADFGTPDHLGRINGAAICLNTGNPSVARWKASNNVDAIALAVVALMAQDAPHGAQTRFNFKVHDGDESFSQTAGTLLSTPISVDGRPLSTVPQAAE